MNFFCSSELVILLQTIDASDPYVATSESVGMHLRGFDSLSRTTIATTVVADTDIDKKNLLESWNLIENLAGNLEGERLERQ